MSELIGKGVCWMPSCGASINVNKAKTGFGCCACNGCKMQFFARSEQATADLLKLAKVNVTLPDKVETGDPPKPAPKPEPVEDFL